MSEYTERLEAIGVSVVVILNEEAESLTAFELKYDIPYLMLGDADSTVIRQFGIFNPSYEKGSRYYGVPYPGIFLVDSEGTIVEKFSEESYRDRPVFDDLMKVAATLAAP